ncbi:MAG: hypothetical protein ACK5D5_03410 [Bacteroidota bacterium]|jgi:hypothetical protein
MNKFFLILVSVVYVSTQAIAQTSFSCNYREYCDWNEEEKKFDQCKGYEESSLFVMNKEQTMFEHTIVSMKSAYYVSEKQYDEENEVWTYEVTSDVGNKYYYIFDPKNKEIRALYVKEDKTYLIRFYVKAIF